MFVVVAVFLGTWVVSGPFHALAAEKSGTTTLELKKTAPSKPEAVRMGIEVIKLEDEFMEEYKGELEEVPDTFENFNRSMHGFNDFLFENVMRPVGTVYSEITDPDFRGMVKSFFENIRLPMRLVSSIFQGNAEKAGRAFARFCINTALTGGLVDVAGTEFGMKEVDEDFDQALGYNGIKTGPYLVWPIVGPSTVRATFGDIVDGFLDPMSWITPNFLVDMGVSAEKKINNVSINLNLKDEIDEMAIDPYLSVRDLYLQYRQGKVGE